MTSFNKITLVQMDGSLTLEEFAKAVDMAVDSCNQIHEMQKTALKGEYLMIKEEVEEKEGSEGAGE